MKPLSKQTLLTILVLVLVVLNIGLVTFMWYTQRPNNGPGGPETANFLMGELHFTKEQETHYHTLQQQFNDSLKPIRDRERQIHDRFFEMMHLTNPDSALVAATIDTMGHIRTEIEYLTFVHFRQVRALCNAEQQARFDQIISEAMRKMGPRPEGPHRRPEKNQGPPPPDAGPHGPPDGPPGN